MAPPDNRCSQSCDLPGGKEPLAETCRSCCKSTSTTMEPVADENNNSMHSCNETETVIRSRNGFIPMELLRSLFVPLQAGLNFDLSHSELDSRLQVIFEGERFQFYCWLPKGTSTWKCVHRRFQGCPAMIGIGGEMALAKFIGDGHKHARIAERLLGCVQGWGKIELDGLERRFWLSHGAGEAERFNRDLFLGGYKYNLRKICNESSVWCCSKGFAGCKMQLIVQGVFDQVKQINQHNHGVISEEIMAKIRVKCSEEIDLASIRKVQSSDLISYNGLSFRLTSIEPDGSRLWRCVWHDIRRCPVIIRKGSDGKQLEPENGQVVHNHPDDLIGAYLQPDGRTSTFDKQEKVKISLWLFTIESKNDLNGRGMIYQGYKYFLITINDSGDSTWKCSACTTTLQITGLFWTTFQQGNHTHSPLTIQEINAITGNPEESSVLSFIPSTKSIPLSKTTLITTLSSFNPSRDFQFHHQDPNNLKILQDGFEYLYVCSKPTYSIWHCIYSSIRCCNGTLRLHSDGIQATQTPHNHSVQLWDLYYTTLGENFILDESSNTVRSFHFLIKPSFERPLPHVIYEGHLFGLRYITECGNGSVWTCAAPDCGVALNVMGTFRKMYVEGLPHREQSMGEDVQLEWVVRYGSEDSF